MMGGQAPSGGMLIIKLKNWSERPNDEDYITSVISEIYRRTANIHSAKLFAFAQPTIMGYSTGSGVELYVQDRAGGSIETLKEHTDKFIAALNARPEVQMAYTTFDTKFPQYLVEVDAARCKRMGVSPSDVLSVMSGYIGGNYASNLNRFSKLYRVYIQADKDFRLDTDALNNMFVRTDGGEMAPIGQFVTLTKAYGPETLTRFNLYSSIQVNAMMNDGYSSGDVIRAAVSAAAIRLRPILMTVLCMAIGMLPLVFASGAGANGNISLGTGVVGGLLVGTLALLFVVPALFIVFQAMQERLMPDRKRDE